jgi:putative nucleotidyltransferase with HDIG domain
MPADRPISLPRVIFLRSVHKLRALRGVERSVRLLHASLLASAVILTGGAVVLGWVLSATIRQQAVEDARTSLTEYVDGVLRPDLVRKGQVAIAPGLTSRIQGELAARRDILTVKVWRADGTLAWTNRDVARIGRRFELDDKLGAAIQENRAVAGIDRLDKQENAAEARLGYAKLLEVYTPIDDGGRVIGAYEIYADPARIERFITMRKHTLWAVVAAVFAVLYAALAVLVRGASSRLRRQTRALRRRSQELLEAYELLETRSLETIETLNATVDAKDPYTAGHSQRVQRIALAIGHELDLERSRLEALRHGALFHDIGKLGVPDAILAKPAKLTPDEYDVIKRHPADGARIVERLEALRAAVPLIRYHHERWDGRGYPEGLAEEAIPLEAAIVGLSDAWDAMTTDRPYHRALSLDEAVAEIRAGRGSQFAPRVVDAFFEALARAPEELAAPESRALAS